MERFIGWAGAVLILITMLVPWGRFGVEPLLWGIVPAWVMAMLAPYILFVILMLLVLRKAEK